jgi:hypothetical protein
MNQKTEGTGSAKENQDLSNIDDESKEAQNPQEELDQGDNSDEVNAAQSPNMLWYHADTQYGTIFLGIRAIYEVHNVEVVPSAKILNQIRLIQTTEHLIRLIEDWLQCGLLLQPTEKNIPISHHAVSLSYNTSVDDTRDQHVVILFSKESLKKLQKPTSQMKQYLIVETSHMPVELILSQFKITEAEQQKLVYGNIVLIPESYEAKWHVSINSIYIDERTVKLLVVLDHDLRSLNIQNVQMDQSKINNNGIPIKIKAANEVSLPFGILFGWDVNITIVLQKSLKDYQFQVMSQGTILACGGLMSIATGYGLRISQDSEA